MGRRSLETFSQNGPFSSDDPSLTRTLSSPGSSRHLGQETLPCRWTSPTLTCTGEMPFCRSAGRICQDQVGHVMTRRCNTLHYTPVLYSTHQHKGLYSVPSQLDLPHPDLPGVLYPQVDRLGELLEVQLQLQGGTVPQDQVHTPGEETGTIPDTCWLHSHSSAWTSWLPVDFNDGGRQGSLGEV